MKCITGLASTIDAKETFEVGVSYTALTFFLTSKYERPSVTLTVHIFSSFQEGQSREVMDLVLSQFRQFSVTAFSSTLSSSEHLTQNSYEARQAVQWWPYSWHIKPRRGFGMTGHQSTFLYLFCTLLGRRAPAKARTKLAVFGLVLVTSFVMLRISITP